MDIRRILEEVGEKVTLKKPHRQPDTDAITYTSTVVTASIQEEIGKDTRGFFEGTVDIDNGYRVVVNSTEYEVIDVARHRFAGKIHHIECLLRKIK